MRIISKLCVSVVLAWNRISRSRARDIRSPNLRLLHRMKIRTIFFLTKRPTPSAAISRVSKVGHGDSLYDDFSYDHRFLITGKWYLRLGVEYERYDFNGTDNGLPDHLQAAYAHIAYEYVVKDFPGVGIELDPGFYFQDHINGDRFDIPIKAFVELSAQKGQNFRGRRFGLVVIPRPAGCARWRNHLAD